MKITQKVKKILTYYEGDSPGIKTNLARFLMQGKLGGTGNMVILPVDQGFEHGPGRSFAANSAAFDPHYHYRLAIDAGLSAYAAPLGWLEAGADTFAGEIPTILKINSSNTLYAADNPPDQAVTASVGDALRLGCSGIGFTIYPGSDMSLDMFEEIRELSAEAKSYGLAVIIWSYARGALSKTGETAVDTIAYGAHMAALLGAHIIKVKLPTNFFEDEGMRRHYAIHKIPVETLEDRVRHVVQACFNGRRLVVFSGGEAKTTADVLTEARAIYAGGGNGSIIGRNCFQRPRAEAIDLLTQLVSVYKGRYEASVVPIK